MATTEGVVRAPSWLGITTGSPPCITATTEFVVPRSIPIILLIAAIPPETFCHSHSPVISLPSRRNQLGSCVPSPARSEVYLLSVCLSSFLMTSISYSFSSLCSPLLPLPASFRRPLLTLDNSSCIILSRHWERTSWEGLS